MITENMSNNTEELFLQRFRSLLSKAPDSAILFFNEMVRVNCNDHSLGCSECPFCCFSNCLLFMIQVEYNVRLKHRKVDT